MNKLEKMRYAAKTKDVAQVLRNRQGCGAGEGGLGVWRESKAGYGRMEVKV